MYMEFKKVETEPYMQNRKRDTDIHRPLDSVGEGEGGMI